MDIECDHHAIHTMRLKQDMQYKGQLQISLRNGTVKQQEKPFVLGAKSGLHSWCSHQLICTLLHTMSPKNSTSYPQVAGEFYLS
jgi:hypothetical protein